MKHKKKSHMHEIAGSSAHSKMMKGREGMSRGFVEGHDEGVGHGDFANMPQNVIMKPYPGNKTLRGGHLDDTITGIDSVISRGDATASRHVSNQK